MKRTDGSLNLRNPDPRHSSLDLIGLGPSREAPDANRRDVPQHHREHLLRQCRQETVRRRSHESQELLPRQQRRLGRGSVRHGVRSRVVELREARERDATSSLAVVAPSLGVVVRVGRGAEEGEEEEGDRGNEGGTAEEEEGGEKS